MTDVNLDTNIPRTDVEIGDFDSDGATEARLAPQPKTVDDFEDQDISEYGGNTGNFTTQSTTVQEGTYALESTVSAFTAPVGISSTSGLSNYPSAGEVFRVYVYTGANSSDRLRMYFASQSEINFPNRYMVGMNREGNDFRLWRIDSNGASLLSSITYSPTNDVWRDVYISWASNGDISVSVRDLNDNIVQNGNGNDVKLSASDATFTSGGIGLQANPVSGNHEGKYDHYRITEVL